MSLIVCLKLRCGQNKCTWQNVKLKTRKNRKVGNNRNFLHEWISIKSVIEELNSCSFLKRTDAKLNAATYCQRWRMLAAAPLSQFSSLTSHFTSRIEYIMPTDIITVLLIWQSNLTKKSNHTGMQRRRGRKKEDRHRPQGPSRGSSSPLTFWAG